MTAAGAVNHFDSPLEFELHCFKTHFSRDFEEFSTVFYYYKVAILMVDGDDMPLG